MKTGRRSGWHCFSLAGDQEDRVALRYLVGYGSDDWRTAQWAKIRAASVAEGKSPWVILTEMKVGTRPTTGVKAVFDRFDKIQTELAGFTGLTGKDLVNAWLPADSPCAELRGLADSVAADDSDCHANALAEKVLEIVTEPDIPDVVPDVRIMSLHKSKGLSANVVIIAGCVEGVMPRRRQNDMTDAEYDESIEEHRRLFFVGVTRVKAAPADGYPGHLIITASRKVPMAIAMKGVAQAGREGGMARTITSHFLAELGQDSPRPISP